MGFLKKLLVPIIIFGVLAILTYLLFDAQTFGNEVMFYALTAELLAVLYFWQYQLSKSKRSGIFYIYLSVIVVFDFGFTLIMAFVRSSENISYNAFIFIYWIVIALSLIAAGLLKLVYRGLNDSIQNQAKGEHGLSKMKQIATETMHILEQYKKDAAEAIKALKEVKEALEYSDPVSHKNVYGIEKQLVSHLKTGLRHAKNKHFGKINAVMKDSNGVLFLVEKRNTLLKESK